MQRFVLSFILWNLIPSSRAILEDSDGFDLFSGGSHQHSLLSDHHRMRRADTEYASIMEAEALIPKNYSIHEPPPTDDGSAIKVELSVLIISIRDINEVGEQLSLELNLQMYWKDIRLSHLSDKMNRTFIVLNPILINQIWHPDIFIDHVKKVEQPKLISTPASLRIYPDETIRYSARLTLQMACPMDFHFYPADTQFCNTDLKSYAYSNKILSLDWREGKEASMLRGIKLPSFEVGLGNTVNFTQSTSSAVYSGIRFTVILRRNISFHMVQTYFPSALFVIISFLSFLVAPESIPGRMTLCMTTLLTLVAIFSGVRQSTPTVSYVKGLDIWMVVCIISVFLCLVEYTVLLKLRNLKPKQGMRKNRRLRARAQRNSNSSASGLPVSATPKPEPMPTLSQGVYTRIGSKELGDEEKQVEMKNGVNNPPAQPIRLPSLKGPPNGIPPAVTDERKKKSEELSFIIERYCSKIIPSIFVIFNLIYWPWLLLSADYFDYEEIDSTHYAD